MLALLAVFAAAVAAGQGAHHAKAVGEGIFNLDKTEYSVPEGTAFPVTIQRTDGGTLTQDVQVILAVDALTEFDIPSAEATKLITFPKGSNLASQTILIQTLNKEQFADRRIQVTILSVSGGGLIGSRSTAPVTILGTGTPRVFGVTPDSGGSFTAENTILTVTGENFIVTGATITSTTVDVQFWPILGGPAATPVTVAAGDVFDVTATSLKVKVPAGTLTDYVASLGNQAAATYHVRVNVQTNPPQTPPTALSPMTNNDHFVYTTGPTVTGLDVRVGPPIGGTFINITGTKFGGTAGSPCPSLAFVRIGINVTECTFTGANSVRVKTAPHVAGPVYAIVTVGGVPSPAVPDALFTYFSPPVITGVAPNFGPQSGGNLVQITGSGFGLGFQLPTQVLFGGNPATFTVINDNTIQAVVPPGAGVQQVRVIHPISGASEFTSVANYTYSSGPLINSMTPSNGPASGGTIVDIRGTGFLPGAIVKFGLNQAFANFVDTTHITATAPAGTGTVDVIVTVNGNPSPPGPQARFSYDGPTVTSVAPIAGPLAGGTAITIKGTNFTTASVVQIGNATVVPTFVDTQTLTAITPPVGSPLAAHVRVTTGSGTSPESPADVFTYTNGPIIDAINPNNGPTLGGTIVVLTGKNFVAPLSITFGGVPATSFNINSATQITVLSPPNGTAGPTDVRIAKGNELSPVGAQTKYTYTSATPKITTLTPNSGSTFGGNEVTITGLGFTGAACPGSVKFGTMAAATCTVVDDSTIITVAPPNIAGPTVVTITTPNGTSDIVPNYTYVSGGNSGGGTAPPAPGPGGTATLMLTPRWTLLTWTGPGGVSISDSVRGTGIPGGSDLSGRITAIYQWDAASSAWKAYFTGADGIPGASDITQFQAGAVYWVAILGTGQVPWVVPAP